MDPQPLNANHISDQYFESINGHRRHSHIVLRNMSMQESKNAEEEEIRADAALWYAGYAARDATLNAKPGTMPPFESVFPVIHKNFSTRVKYAPEKV